MAEEKDIILRHPKDPSALLDIIRDVQDHFGHVPEEAVARVAAHLKLSEAGVPADGRIGVFSTSCIGMSDQEPSAIINGVVFTRLTPLKVKHLVKAIKTGKPVRDMVTAGGDGPNQSDLVRSMVSNNIRTKGPVIFGPFESGSAIKNAVARKPEEIIAEDKKSKMLARGG